MNKSEEKRFQQLQEDAQKEIGKLDLKNLTYPDLLLLLNQDKKLRKLIKKIVATNELELNEDDTPDDAVVTTHQAQVEDLGLNRPIAASHIENSLQNELAPELALLSLITADLGLARDWLRESDFTDGRKLARLIARSAQWDNVLGLWDCLAERCKIQKRPANSDEQLIMAGCLEIHNLLWFSRQAELSHIVPGESFDFKRHDRALPQGETVLEEWLPGLTNAGGQTQRRPLVKT